MPKRTKRRLAIILWERFVGGVALIKSCRFVFAVAVSATPTAQAIAQSPDSREVTVGIPASFPPYYQIDATGKPSGFGIDVMEAVAARAGVVTRYKVFKVNRESVAALQNGKIDVLPSLGVSKNRQQAFEFTSPVDTFQISLFVRKDTIDIEGLNDLAGRPVGAVVPNLAHRMLRKRDDIELKTFKDVPSALFALLSGQIDALAYPEPVAWKFARAAKISERIKVAPKPIAEIKRAMALRKGNMELLALLEPAIREFVASEEYRKTYVIWFGAPAPFWTVSKIFWVMVIVVVMLISAMAGWRYYSLAKLNSGLRASIQEREKAEQALRESEERFRDVAETASDWIWEMGPDLRFTYLSERYTELTGISPEDRIGTKRGDFALTSDYEDDAERWETHQKDLQARRPFKNFEYASAATEDGYRFVTISGKPLFGENGEFLGYRGTATDITDQKLSVDVLRERERALEESHKLLQALIDGMPEFIALKDAQGRYLFVNRVFEEWCLTSAPLGHIEGFS